MKQRLLSTLFASVMAVGAFALPGTTVKGTWDRSSDGIVKLFRVEHGRLEEVSSFKIGKDKKFGFYFQPEYEGIYVIGTGFPMAQTDKYNFYFKGGEELNLNVNDSSYTLTGVNSAENKELARWHDFVYPLERKAVYFMKVQSTYVDFFPDLEKFTGNVQKYTAGKTGNKKFETLFPTVRQLDMYKVTTMYLSTPRSAHPETNQLPEFYRKINTKSVTKNAAWLNLPYGMRTIESMSYVENRIKGVDRPSLEQKLASLDNDTLKGEAVLSEAGVLKTYLGYQELEQKYGKYIITADQQARSKEIIAKLAKAASKPGQQAINFTYPDLDGKKVSLTDFKGKVVLVDVWATWCGPCKAEIPALKKMEEEMHNQDVVFMSVSVDEAKDHQKWKDFVAKENLKGVQLFASGWSEIAKYYEIKGIPRFMVFDKKGNIVSIDAPRPSSPELKLLLESELKK